MKGPPAFPTDMNADGGTDGGDIARFVAAVIANSSAAGDVCAGDFSLNGVVDAPDVGPFVGTLLAN